MRIQFLCPLCLRCGSLRIQASLFCRTCEIDFLFPRMQRHHRFIKDERVDYLLQWVPNESDSLSELVYLLKSWLSFPVWKFYVEQLITRHPEKMELKTAIIPIPGSREEKVAYHTRHFALAWQQLSPGDIVPCLKTAPRHGEQKNLTLEERGDTVMSFVEDFTSAIYGYDRIILLDDIVTSGNTLQASLGAIKPHLRSDCLVEIKALLSRGKI